MLRLHLSVLALAGLLTVGCGGNSSSSGGGGGTSNATPQTGPMGPGAPGGMGSPPMGPGGGAPGMMGGGGVVELSIPTDPTPVAIAAGVAALSPENSKIEFLGLHMKEPPDPRLGGFEKFTGTAQVEGGTLKSVTLDIDATSLWTQMGGQLTGHLNAPDFLGTVEYPTAKFQSRGIQATDAAAGKYTVNGDFTLHGVTKPISIPATIKVTDAGLTLIAQFKIDRTEYGMNQNLERVSKEVPLAVVIGDKTQPKTGGGFGGGPGGRGGPGPGGFDPVAMFKGWDKDGDGKLAGDEIPDRMKQNLDAVDTDKDGAVTLEEFQERMRSFAPGGAGGPPGGGPPGGGPPGGVPPGAGAPPGGKTP
ncbi:MAG: YceI family protein [Planctomycetales bacterium]